MTVLQFPSREQKLPRQKPDRVRVVFDFGAWTLAYYAGDRFTSRLDFASEEDARAEAARLVRTYGFILQEA